MTFKEDEKKADENISKICAQMTERDRREAIKQHHYEEWLTGDL